MSAIKIAGLTRDYGNGKGIFQVSFEVSEGEVFGFLASCVFSDTKRPIAFGAGFPALMHVVQMLANVGGKAEQLKYVTYFTLFNPDGILAGETCDLVGAAVLLAGAAVLFALAEQVFCRKDLHI